MVAAYCHKLFYFLIWFFNEFQTVLFSPVFLPYFSSFLRKKNNLDSLAFFNVVWKALRYKIFNHVHFALGIWESSFRFKSLKTGFLWLYARVISFVKNEKWWHMSNGLLVFHLIFPFYFESIGFLRCCSMLRQLEKHFFSLPANILTWVTSFLHIFASLFP